MCNNSSRTADGTSHIAPVEIGAKNGAFERVTKAEDFESRRLTFGFWLLVSALISMVVIFVLVVVVLGNRFDTAASVLSLVTTTTTVIGTLVGFYFGAQVGASGSARVEVSRQELAQQNQQSAQQAQDTAREAVGVVRTVEERAG